MRSRTVLSILLILLFGVVMNASAQELLDRTVRPKGQEVPKISLPKIQKAKLSNGLNVWLVEHNTLPIVAFNLVFQTGSDHDPADRPGLASMTADVIDEGTHARDALQISEEMNFIGASFSVRSSTDGTSMYLHTLTKHLDAALDVFVDVLTNPTFPQKEFDRLKKQRVTSLLQQRDQPSTIASLNFGRLIYGPDHPYGRDASGTEASLNEMTRDDLMRFYQTYYRPNNATLIIVGNAKLKVMTARLEKVLKGWKPAGVPRIAVPAPAKLTERTIYLIDKPGAAQSEIRIGYPALARSTKDYFAVSVMNRVLGGQFTSRLNLNLREQRGFTYGARSSFNFLKGEGPFTAGAAVTSTKSDSSVREFIYEIDLMHEKGITAEELEFVKKSLAGGFPLGFETPSQIAGGLQNIVLYNLPENYFETYLQSIDAVTLADVQTASQKYLNSKRMAIVVVGDLKLIKEGIEKLGLGPVVVCDVEGNKISQ